MKNNFNWMAILRTGNFIDKNGQKVSIDETKLDNIIAATDLSKEPQLVIEHPSYDKIGFGTIDKLKRVGQYLFALPKDVNEKFKSLVNNGDLPGRSVTLNKDTFALNNISFLPKEIQPAVSGLGDYCFSTNGISDSFFISLPGEQSHFADIETNNYELAQYEISSYPFRSIQTLFRNIKNLFIEKYSLDDAEKVIPEYTLNDSGTVPSLFDASPQSSLNNNVNSFSKNLYGDKMELDLTKLSPDIRVAIETLQNEVTTLKTDLTAKNVELQSATNKLSAAETEKLRNEVLQFCESEDIKLKIMPADKEKFVSFLMKQKEKAVIEFSSADNTKVQFSSYDFTKELIKKLPNVIELNELATGKNATDNNLAGYQKVAKSMADSVNRKS